MTANISLCGLGNKADVNVVAPGWEPALGWGGFQVGSTKLHFGSASSNTLQLKATSAGAQSQICGITLVQRNQLQQTAIYCTFGTPLVAHCDIVGSVYVAGGAARPCFEECLVTQSRGFGFTFVDHAGGRVARCRIVDNKLGAIEVDSTAQPTVTDDSAFRGNGVDAICPRRDLLGSSDIQEFFDFEDIE